MILAAADAAEGSGEPPEDLQLAWHVQRWRALPKSGGLDNQPAGLVQRMSVLANVYDAVSLWRRESNWARWSQENPAAWRIVQMVIELRKEAEECQAMTSF